MLHQLLELYPQDNEIQKEHRHPHTHHTWVLDLEPIWKSLF